MNKLNADDIFGILLKMNTLILMLLIFLSRNVLAESPNDEFTFLYLTYYKSLDTCQLQEKGWVKKDTYFLFDGKKDKENEYCVVQIAKSSFDSNFGYCNLSPFDQENNSNGACVSELRGENYVFMAGVPNNKDRVFTQLCNFTCRAKTDGNRAKQ